MIRDFSTGREILESDNGKVTRDRLIVDCRGAGRGRRLLNLPAFQACRLAGASMCTCWSACRRPRPALRRAGNWLAALNRVAAHLLTDHARLRYLLVPNEFPSITR